jgi:sugar transferase (PEP-CTERM/EpsH1 system associated)
VCRLLQRFGSFLLGVFVESLERLKPPLLLIPWLHDKLPDPMTVLFLTPRIPYPPYRGDKLKIWNLLRVLSRHHDIVLLTFIQSKEEERFVQQLRAVCREVQVVYLPRWKSMLSCFVALFRPIPFQVAYYRSPRMRKILQETLGRVYPQLVHTHLIRMAQYTAHYSSIPRVLDVTDAVSLYLKRFLVKERNPLKKVGLFVEHCRVKHYERIVRKFDCTLVCSEVDRTVLRQAGEAARIELLYNGVDLDIFSENGTVAYERHSVIYTGNMTYYPNKDGAIYLARKIFPLVQKKISDAKLYIVGQDPPKKVKSLESTHIVVTGFVPDIHDYYLRSAVAVSPIRFGAGTLNKILEPLALGVPVVSTSVGFEGLQLRQGEDILVADNPRAFAEAIIAVLTDQSLRKKLSDNGKRAIRNLYSWDNIGQELEAIYTTVLESSKLKNVKA